MRFRGRDVFDRPPQTVERYIVNRATSPHLLQHGAYVVVEEGIVRQPTRVDRDTVLPPSVRGRVSIEAASPFGWERYVGLDGAIISVDGFGASAPGPVVTREFGLTTERVVEVAQRVLGRN